MTTGCRRRANNSLSYQKFINRLDKGLPVFIAYVEPQSYVTRHDNCRNLHWLAWRYPSPNSGGAYFIDITHYYPSLTCENTASLKDMNVWRNKYNQNFVFRTQWAAEQYLLDIGAISTTLPGLVGSKAGIFKNLVARVVKHWSTKS